MLSLSILYQLLKADRPSIQKSDRTFLSNAIAHQSKNAIAHQSKNAIAHQPKNVKIPKTPAVGNRGYKNKTRLRGLKISPDNFPSPNTLFVRGGGHCLCRRGFQPPGF
ncbi:hypothetical protein [Tychonema sp. BBK16]|uniref:hypothetical protein n=1 Tax=Tychonema sp. BBK16 TaxID=2699888 RepID=UPI001F3F686A|nr:hypothetical protein [Tychonema sp. BBK16]MCF6372522.1 hypothetical protein [Tychonema sp. BBK16]